jgi:hypothetical protein
VDVTTGVGSRVSGLASLGGLPDDAWLTLLESTGSTPLHTRHCEMDNGLRGRWASPPPERPKVADRLAEAD